MPDNDGMTLGERYRYLARMRRRYVSADRRERGRLLDEIEAMTGLHRKSVLRRFQPGGLVRKLRGRQRGRTYGAAVDDALRVIWESLDFVCAERLTPALVPTARLLARHGELHLTEELVAHLMCISRASVQRRLTRLTQDVRQLSRLPRPGPERANRANALLRRVPMGRIPWNETEPGHFEVDLVHHGGSEPAGEYVHTLQLIDVATGWSERVAVLGRGQAAMEEGFRRVLVRLPFPVRELHPDNGSEFFNAHLVHFWGEAITGLRLSRSRPYKKNDNRFVEQKNDSLVRAYLGYTRLDTPAQCAALNVLYDHLWVYYNLCQPVLHLVEKTAIQTPTGSRVRRRWDAARTPFERLASQIGDGAAGAAGTGPLTISQRNRLVALRDATNPRALRRALYAARDQLLQRSALPASAPPQNVAA
jgi:hypothetical protein